MYGKNELQMRVCFEHDRSAERYRAMGRELNRMEIKTDDKSSGKQTLYNMQRII